MLYLAFCVVFLFCGVFVLYDICLRIFALWCYFQDIQLYHCNCVYIVEHVHNAYVCVLA